MSVSTFIYVCYALFKLKHIKAKIELDDNATPRFHKTYAQRPKIDAELLSLEESFQG